ncbi:MAG: hypothetical protein PHS37_10200 [Candidatus Omnitrophica bacterium]|nr:hypothetical protein [Candidatus Omnitrophota bacterium]
MDPYTYLKRIEHEFRIAPGAAQALIKSFHGEMRKGLARRKSSLKMLPTYVGRPSGNERGTYMAIDLGGSNFRVLLVTLKGGGAMSRPVSAKYRLDKKHITSTGQRLFDFIARAIKDFTCRHKEVADKHVEVGFTFSFPVKQRGIASGVLKSWTKGFSARGVIGKDVVALLKEALSRAGLDDVTVTALANDTVGTMVAGSYRDTDCDVGVILGTGTNACYPDANKDMIINTEWGNFNKLRTTRFDNEVDRSSRNPGQQIFEKMISGMYLGQVCRFIVLDLIGRGLLFPEKRPAIFSRPYMFTAEHMSLIEEDRSPSLGRVKEFLSSNGLAKNTYDDRALLRQICRMISGRAARLSVAGVLAVITFMDPALRRRHTVAIDGTVFEKYYGFKNMMRQSLKYLGGIRARRIKLALTKDGSGAGAAIIAACADSA